MYDFAHLSVPAEFPINFSEESVFFDILRVCRPGPETVYDISLQQAFNQTSTLLAHVFR